MKRIHEESLENRSEGREAGVFWKGRAVQVTVFSNYSRSMDYIEDDNLRSDFVDEQRTIIFNAIQRLYHRAHVEHSIIYPNKDCTSLHIKGSPGIQAGMQNGFNSKTIQKNVLKAVEDWGRDKAVFKRIGHCKTNS